jgi:6-pyruvoyltetrahydropterin/6-carboxytetrahydropterin synthase
MYRSTKTFGHEVGLSCAFRQWRANSHCNKLHGYALSFTFTFEADELDARNWVVDFGSFSDLRDRLKYWFDHTTVVASDDPLIWFFRDADQLGLLSLRELDSVGCEAFAATAFYLATGWLQGQAGLRPRVRLVSVEVREHGANSAIYLGEEG